jgi:hypothetical protein
MCLVTRPLRAAEFKDRDGKTHAFTRQILEVARVVRGLESRFQASEFLVDSRSRRGFPKLLAILNDIGRHGVRVNDSRFKRISRTKGIFEFKSDQLRLFCFEDGNSVICVNGAVKKDNQTDPSDIKTATDWQEAYFEAKKTGKLRHEK